MIGGLGAGGGPLGPSGCFHSPGRVNIRKNAMGLEQIFAVPTGPQLTAGQ